MDSVRSTDLVVERESLFDVDISDEQAALMRTLCGVAESPAVRAGRGGGAG